jgi:DUF3017 family protein
VTEVRRRRRTKPRGQQAPARWLSRLPYALVLCAVAAGLTLFALAYFRKGAALMATGVLLGAIARLVLAPSQVGMLAVRKKWLDVLTMVALAVALATVAYVVPGK